MKDRKEKPIVRKGKEPTLVGLGYLNSVFCPKCRKLLFAHYDKDLTPNNGWRLAEDWNYCSKCGQHLDLDVYKKLNELQNSDEDVNFDD